MTLQSLSHRLAWTLLHSTWQIAAISLTLLLLLFILPTSIARLRYTLSCAALLLSLLSLPLTFTRLAPPPAQTPTAFATTISPSPSTALPLPTPIHPNQVKTIPWLDLLVITYLAGLLILSTKQLGGWLLLQRIRHSRSTLLPTHLLSRLDRLRHQLRIPQSVLLLESPFAAVPLVVGFLKPAILLPIGLASHLSVADLDSILAHELAHIRRHDYLANLFQTAIETLLFYHPCVWYISSQIRQEREHCADDAAISITPRAQYLRALAGLEELRLTLPAPAATTGSLLRRIRRLTLAHRSPRHTPLVALLVIATLFLSPLAANHFARAATPKPTTQVASEPAPSPVTPDDLVVGPINDYVLSPADLIKISINDLTAPGVETVKQSRITETGTIALPFLDPLKVAGLTADQARKAIAKAYQDNHLMMNAVVSVEVTENRNNVFSVIGGQVQHPGQYPITKPDTRLLDAIAITGARISGMKAYVIRGTGPTRRIISVDLKPLLAGDESLNLVIRRGDTILVTPPLEKQYFRVVVSLDGSLSHDNQPTNWTTIEKILTSQPHFDPSSTVLELSASSDDVRVGTYNSAFAAADQLVKRLGLSYLSNTGVQH